VEKEFAEEILKRWGLWRFDTLQQVKEALKFSVSNPQSKLVRETIQSPDDCFGRDYGAEAEECRNCTAQVSVGGLVDELVVPEKVTF
jgi:hypothetical protein